MTRKKTFIAIGSTIIAALLILATVFMLKPKNKIEASAEETRAAQNITLYLTGLDKYKISQGTASYTGTDNTTKYGYGTFSGSNYAISLQEWDGESTITINVTFINDNKFISENGMVDVTIGSTEGDNTYFTGSIATDKILRISPTKEIPNSITSIWVEAAIMQTPILWTTNNIFIMSNEINVTEYLYSATLVYYEEEIIPQYKSFTKSPTFYSSGTTTLDLRRQTQIRLDLVPGVELTGVQRAVGSITGEKTFMATVGADKTSIDITISKDAVDEYSLLYIIPEFSGTPSPDPEGSYEDGYNDGYTNGYQEGYKNGSNSGEAFGYQKGYNEGYDKGYGNGLADGQGSPGDFLDLTTAVVDAPVKVITEMMDVEILGFNMKDVAIGLLSAAIIIWLIKKFAGA